MNHAVYKIADLWICPRLKIEHLFPQFSDFWQILTFISAGQHPWKDCKEEFKSHLDGLSKLPLYGGCKTSSHVIEDRNLESRTGLSLPDMGLEVDREETVVEALIWAPCWSLQINNY